MELAGAAGGEDPAGAGGHPLPYVLGEDAGVDRPVVENGVTGKNSTPSSIATSDSVHICGLMSYLRTMLLKLGPSQNTVKHAQEEPP